MDCPEFLARHSEFLDDRLPPADVARMRRHLAICTACAGYDRAVRRAADQLRALPEVEPSPDFKPRLRHRIFHLRDDGPLREGRGSGTSLPAVLLLAILMAAVAWSPLVRDRTPEVSLEPVVVTRSLAEPGLQARLGRVRLVPEARSSLWSTRRPRRGSNALLYLYSPLAGSERGTPVVRTIRIDE